MSHLQDEHGVTLLGNTPAGTCPMCATKHGPKEPHNQTSLTYQYKFYDEFGRWPTWADAMAHCDEDMKAAWIATLEERGINIESGVK